MFYLNLDESGYLLSVSKTKIMGGVEYDTTGFDFSGFRIQAYYYDGEQLIFDDARYAELEAEQNAPVETPVTADDVLKTLLGVKE